MNQGKENSVAVNLLLKPLLQKKNSVIHIIYNPVFMYRSMTVVEQKICYLHIFLDLYPQEF